MGTGEAPDDGTVHELLARLRGERPRAMSTAFRTSGPTASAGDDLYEAFLFALVLRAARAEGYEVGLEDGTGRPPAVVRLRRSPGRLYSSQAFTHAVLTLSGTAKPPLAVHTGVAVAGKSKVAHEADVVVLQQPAAERCRQLGTDPQSSKAVMVVEGKVYRKQPVGLGTGREFLGLDSDLSTKTTIFAATFTSLSIVHLLQGKAMSYSVGVLPGCKGEQEVRELFAQALRGYRNAP
ncbi:hypothetical protein JNUCC0626_48355 [Lentzea sp. JNUCC 0626]|uniref:hypothetical protein n=1 Tax=Lentzea sp. JNUCC 0626 TaxID=3367513 RepID=UPI0037484545